MKLCIVVLVALCVLQIRGTHGQYVPGSCRAADRQLDVTACMSGDNFCEWCDVEGVPDAGTVANMRGALDLERRLYVDKRLTTEPPGTARGPIEAEFDAAVVDIPAFNPTYPQRCGRKWTPETCPGKIVFKITPCEKARHSFAREEATETARALAYRPRETSDYDGPRENSEARQARALFITFRDTYRSLCTTEPPAENCDGCRRSDEAIAELLGHAEDDEKYTALSIRTDEPEVTAADVDAQRLNDYIKAYVNRMTPPNQITTSGPPEVARLSPVHSCHQHLTPVNCYRAGCSFCLPEQRSSGHADWAACQPAWQARNCPTRVPGLPDSATRAVIADPAADMWAHFRDSGKFVRPEASRAAMAALRRTARAIEAIARTQTEEEDGCRSLSTLGTCLDPEARCKWCEFPLDAALPRCRSEWNSPDDAVAVCYSPPLPATSLGTIKTKMTSAYTGAVKQKRDILEAYEQRSRDARAARLERSPPTSSGGEALRPYVALRSALRATPQTGTHGTATRVRAAATGTRTGSGTGTRTGSGTGSHTSPPVTGPAYGLGAASSGLRGHYGRALGASRATPTGQSSTWLPVVDSRHRTVQVVDEPDAE